MARLAISLLGPVQLSIDGAPVRTFPYDKVTALLAYLAVEASRPQRRERLAALLWPDHDSRAARHSLSQALFCLRDLVEDSADQPLVIHTRHTVQFNHATEHWIDVVAFQDLLDRRDRHNHPAGQLCGECARWLRQAVELYRGDFLEQLSIPDAVDFEDWVLAQRAAFRNQTLRAIDDLIEYHDRQENLAEACSYARRQLALDPYREECHRRLMSLLARSGERSAAMIHYERCRQLLRDELGIEPEDATTALFQRIRDNAEVLQSSPTVPSRRRPRYELPLLLTPFVGRRAELARLTELLFDAKARLITLIGPGGIGKTRLALQATASAAEAFADGACFVPLAGVPNGGLLVSAIADALSFQFHGADAPLEQLLDFLRERELLLVLDNFEHLLDEVVLVSRLLERAPRLQVVVTSRERLQLHAESVFEVEGLDAPPEAETQNLADYDAVQLFIQNARRTWSGFNPDSDAIQAVARICRLVGGLPLGIELAAAWVPVLSCAEIAAEITKGLDFLAAEIRDLPERHRSIRAVFDRSWQMLTPLDQDVFCRLSVFRGGFRRDAAESVVGRALPSLSALVRKSLLHRNAHGRYEMHELIRQYAEDQLVRTPEAALHARDQHSEYYARLLAQRAETLQGRGQEAALAELNAEIENVRAAWHWAVKQRNAVALLNAVHGLWLFSEITGRYAEAVSAFAVAVRAIESAAVDDLDSAKTRALALGRLLAHQGSFVFRIGGVETANRLVDRAIDLLRPLDSAGDLGLALNFRAMGAHAHQDYAAEQQYLSASIECLSRDGDKWGLAYSINDLGMARYCRGDGPDAKQLCQQSLELFDEIGDKRGTAFALRNLGVITFGMNDFAAARRYLAECLAIRRSIGNLWGIADALYQLGVATRSVGDRDQALQELREALKIAADINAMSLALQVLVEVADLRAQLGESADATTTLAAIASHPAGEPAVQDRARSLLLTLDPNGTRELTAEGADRIVRREIQRLIS